MKATFARFHRFGLATVAPAMVSAGNFALQLAVLKIVDAGAFGLFAFILGFVQFGFGISNALVATPYTVWANGAEPANEEARAFFDVNLVFSLAWGLSCAILAFALGSGKVAWLVGLYGGLSMLRWFGRTHLYALHLPAAAALSDLVYAVVLFVCLAAAWWFGLTLEGGFALLCLATLAGLLATSRDFLRQQFWSFRPKASLAAYRQVWREQGQWNLLGVTSSEATSNAHSYVITLFAGPAALAPIAGATLLIKPITLVILSLTQLERPVMAREIAAGNSSAALRCRDQFLLAACVNWAATTFAGLALLVWEPNLLFKPNYDLTVIRVAFAFWALISLLQCLATPSSVLLQAARYFRLLAQYGVISGLVAIVAVVACAYWLPPVYSLLGLVLGQLVINVGIWRMEGAWRTAAGISRQGASQSKLYEARQ